MTVFTVSQLAEICGGAAEGETSRQITGANGLENATATDLSFAAAGKKAMEAARQSKAGCLVAPLSFDVKGDWAVIKVREPRAAFGRALALLYPRKRPPASVHPTAVVAEDALIAKDCYIGAHVSIGKHAKIAGGCY